ncbi:hypothetical protein P8Q88_10500 [Qipengyuania sp. XHP0207]|uniref:hypothetical protein n=1 Tax=Qipengyuania sp. XHP0207 TaxID=3038078 RepID=UPI00241FCEA4|nr:hypothetical protein [Qipengyuania sp. XHP0207]MDG5748608.1 hypothetical protein [Qipengyuania sp. XHP0207]
MKPIYAHAAGALALSSTIAACVPAPDSTPAPEPVATSTPTPTPSAAPLPPPPMESDWIDQPQTAGSWSYRATGNSTRAYFGSASSPGGAFSLECKTPGRIIELGRPGRTSQSITIRTETASRTLAAGSGEIASPASTVAQLSANDPLLDAMALTRGRFAVETPEMPTLYLPAWAEVTRVIEDCRR